MEVKIIAHTAMSSEVNQTEIKKFAGLNAGVCYMPATWEELESQTDEKILARAETNLISQHHSVFDHYSVNLLLKDVPKFIAMLLNNQKLFATSEKSARYTKMKLQPEEQVIYDKWYQIFLDLIDDKYPSDKYCNCAYWGMNEKANKRKREKLAQENARYLTSIFTPTTMTHTLNIRQLNYVYRYLEDITKLPNPTKLQSKAIPYIQEFLNSIDSRLIIDKLDASSKSSKLKFWDTREYQPCKIYGDIFQTHYLASFAELAQAQRHRTLNYTIKELDTPQYYIPPIIRDKQDLVKEYLADMKSLENNIPQATLVQVFESGTMDDFILKMKERKCSYAQLEINDITQNTLQEYCAVLGEQLHPMTKYMQSYLNGSRCTFVDYKCPAPCGFKEGVIGNRII